MIIDRERGGSTGGKAGDKWINRWSPSDASLRMTEQQGTCRERVKETGRGTEMDTDRERREGDSTIQELFPFPFSPLAPPHAPS